MQYISYWHSFLLGCTDLLIDFFRCLGAPIKLLILPVCLCAFLFLLTISLAGVHSTSYWITFLLVCRGVWGFGLHRISYLSRWASPESRGIAPFMPLRPFSGVTPPIRVLPSDGETRTSLIYRHTSSWYSHPSGVTILKFTIKVYKIYGLSETVDYGYRLLGCKRRIIECSPCSCAIWDLLILLLAWVHMRNYWM